MLKCLFTLPLLLHYFIKYCRPTKLLIAGCLGLGFLTQANALNPALIDMQVNDTPLLELTTGVDYLLVLNNNNSHGTRIYFGEFAQGVFTHYLQGSAGVSYDSIDVPSNAKVTWLFSPLKAGDYEYYAVDGSNDQKGQKGKIHITLAESTMPELPLQTDLDTSSSIETTESKSEAKETKPKRRWLKGGRRD